MNIHSLLLLLKRMNIQHTLIFLKHSSWYVYDVCVYVWMWWKKSNYCFMPYKLGSSDCNWIFQMVIFKCSHLQFLQAYTHYAPMMMRMDEKFPFITVTSFHLHQLLFQQWLCGGKKVGPLQLLSEASVCAHYEVKQERIMMMTMVNWNWFFS